jgi:hypothetical protein
MKTIRIQGIEFASANEAIQHVSAEGVGKAISIGGKFIATTQVEARRLEADGIAFAYLGTAIRGDGVEVIVTVPVN